jgi:hypothetical protein
MSTILLLCHQFHYEPSTISWLWLLPAAMVGTGFTISLAGLVREIKGGRK